MTYLTTEQHAELGRAMAALGALATEGETPVPIGPEGLERLMLEYMLESFPKNVAWIQQQAQLLKALRTAVGVLLTDLREATETTYDDELQAWLDARADGPWRDAAGVGAVGRLRAILKDIDYASF